MKVLQPNKASRIKALDGQFYACPLISQNYNIPHMSARPELPRSPMGPVCSHLTGQFYACPLISQHYSIPT